MASLSYRFGGEEFVVLLPNTTANAAAEMANVLKKMMTSTIALADNNALSLTASFGVSDYGETVEDLLNNADEDMYLAKIMGATT